MKKFTFLMLSFLLASITVFGQERQAIKLPADMQSADEQKSEWYGHSGIASLLSLAPGYEYAIRDTANVAPVGSDITTVKFYNDHVNYGYPSADYNIKIYEGGSFDSATGMGDASAAGTEVYTQSYVASVVGMQEVELTTPYTVSSGEYWVAIENAHPTDTAAMFMGGVDASTNGQYVMFYNYSGTDYWLSIALQDGVHPATLSFYYDDGGVYEETSDLDAYGFLDNPDDQNWITELELEQADSLILYPVFTNNGPDDAADMMNISISVDGNDVDNFDVNPVTDLAGGSFGTGALTFFPIPMMSGAEMDAAELEVFDVCFTITYSGTDDDPTNDEGCITVTRLLVGLDSEAKNALSVYPNPANNVLNIENAQGATVSVYNMIGQELVKVNVNDNMQAINVSELPEGSYVVRIANGAKIKAQKLNIVR